MRPREIRTASASREPFTVGLEEELLLVDAETLQLAHVADRIVPNTGLPSAARGSRGVPGRDRGALGALSDRCPRLWINWGRGGAAAIDAGATLLAAGLHPDARLFDVELVRSERYERVERQMQGLIKRTPECALHVHVGVPDTDAAVAAMNGIRERLPLLHGLGANSPFWFGSRLRHGQLARRGDPGLSGPRHPAACSRSWDQYLACLDAVRAGGGPTDHTMVWWDARPQPRLGTVELREVDVQTDLESAAAIAALARAIMRRAVEEPVGDPAPEQALHWSSFRAARDGLDAEIYFDGSPRPLREVAEAVLDRIGADADPEIEGIRRIVREGNGADRQRAVFKDGGMPALLRYLADANCFEA